MDAMKKMLMKKQKEGKSLSDNQIKAKSSVLENLKSAAEEMMGEKLKGLKKVTVAADNKDDLKRGLDKAKELIAGQPDPDMEELEEMTGDDLDHTDYDKKSKGEQEEEKEQEEESEDDDSEEMSEEEIDEKLKKLMALKTKKSMKG